MRDSTCNTSNGYLRCSTLFAQLLLAMIVYGMLSTRLLTTLRAVAFLRENPATAQLTGDNSCSNLRMPTSTFGRLNVHVKFNGSTPTT